jgi:hypothetical protein
MRSNVASKFKRMYPNFRPLDKRKFHNRRGNVFVEFDGLFAVKRRDTDWMLVTLECKQTVFSADFDYRLSQIETFKEFVNAVATEDKVDEKADVSSFIQDCDALRRHGSKGTYCMNFLGGSSISESDRMRGGKRRGGGRRGGGRRGGGRRGGGRRGGRKRCGMNAGRSSRYIILKIARNIKQMQLFLNVSELDV